jgi:hypothetical protein
LREWSAEKTINFSDRGEGSMNNLPNTLFDDIEEEAEDNPVPTSESTNIRGKTYTLSPELEVVASQVLEAEELQVYPARIKYMLVYPHISKRVAGRCVLASALVKFFGDADYVIQMSGELWDSLPDEVRRVLMYHELLHVMPVFNEKKGTWDFKLRDHDIQDFLVITEKYGIDWLKNLRAVFASVYEIDDLESVGM